MGTRSLAALDIDSESIPNHHCFCGLAIQRVHGLQQQRRFWLANYLRRDAAACFDCSNHSATAWQEASRDWQQCITIDGDKMRACTYSKHCRCELLIIKVAIKTYQHNVRFYFRVRVCYPQLVCFEEVAEGWLADEVDDGSWETACDILYRRLART